MQRQGKVAWTLGLMCDCLVLCAAGIVVVDVYLESLENGRRDRSQIEEVQEPQEQGPVVDWSNAYEGWSANTGEPVFDLPFPLSVPGPLPAKSTFRPKWLPSPTPEVRRLPSVERLPLVPVPRRRPLVPVQPLKPKPKPKKSRGEATGPVMVCRRC